MVKAPLTIIILWLMPVTAEFKSMVGADNILPSLACFVLKGTDKLKN